jgi:hypothetical protein
MQEGTARLWKEGARWAIEIEIDGVPYTERDYADDAIASILRQHAERAADLDQEACSACEAPLDLMVCSQYGASAFVRTCAHRETVPIRLLEAAVFCRACRP